MSISGRDRKALLEALNSRLGEGASTCPMCRRAEFALLERYVSITVTEDPQLVRYETQEGTPCAALVCENCGYVSLHMIQQLGFTDSRGWR